MIKDYYLELGIDSEISKEFETNIGRELKNMTKEGTLDRLIDMSHLLLFMKL